MKRYSSYGSGCPMQAEQPPLRAGYTVTHAIFATLRLPAQAVIIEVKASGMAELDNGLRFPQRLLKLVDTGEQWVPIAEYDRYLLSSQGKVISLFYHGANRPRLLKILAPTTYPKVTLTNEAGFRQIGLSRLVAQAFLPPPAETRMRCVIPKDGNPLNVHVDNLRWADPYDMQDEAVIHYLRRRGERNAHSKLTTKEVAKIRELVAQGATRQAVANVFEVSRPTISQIVNGFARCYS